MSFLFRDEAEKCNERAIVAINIIYASSFYNWS